MEMLEIFNEDGNFTGKIENRGVVHRDGLWHRVIHLWIYNDKGEVLIQKRSKNKDAHPGLWDISAAGHIDIGESPETAVLREAKEELGIDIERERLEFFDIVKINLVDKLTGIKDNEITYIFLYKHNGELKDFNIDHNEVSKIKFIDLKELKEEIKNNHEKNHFVPFNNSYYLQIITHISKIIKG